MRIDIPNPNETLIIELPNGHQLEITPTVTKVQLKLTSPKHINLITLPLTE